MRHVKQIASRPLELDGEAAPAVEEPACVIDRELPFLIQNRDGFLALQPSPGIQMGSGGHGIAIFELGFLGAGKDGRGSNYALNCIICHLSIFTGGGRSCCSFNGLRHVAASPATPVTPATPVFGVIWSLVARSPFILASIKDTRREDVDTLVCASDFSHWLEAIARP
jgi:hypothetical protein